MSSYVYMKILESQPKRYDVGIALLSFGKSERIKRRIVNENVREGDRVLEIGVGTGTMALLAAERGARVVGFDVSPSMLRVAREKIAAGAHADRIELFELGVSGMEQFPDGSFDVVMSTLVFSELSSDERAYALSHAYRVLTCEGRLALADEVRPKNGIKRIVHASLRFPLAVLTFALTQTSTRSVEGLEEAVAGAGFRVLSAQRSVMEAFLYVVAVKECA